MVEQNTSAFTKALQESYSGVNFTEILKNIKIEPKEFTLDGIKLFQSILTKEGPIYKEIDY